MFPIQPKLVRAERRGCAGITEFTGKPHRPPLPTGILPFSSFAIAPQKILSDEWGRMPVAALASIEVSYRKGRCGY
jgi:hypothetical protein